MACKTRVVSVAYCLICKEIVENRYMISANVISS